MKIFLMIFSLLICIWNCSNSVRDAGYNDITGLYKYYEVDNNSGVVSDTVYCSVYHGPAKNDSSIIILDYDLLNNGNFPCLYSGNDLYSILGFKDSPKNHLIETVKYFSLKMETGENWKFPTDPKPYLSFTCLAADTALIFNNIIHQHITLVEKRTHHYGIPRFITGFDREFKIIFIKKYNYPDYAPINKKTDKFLILADFIPYPQLTDSVRKEWIAKNSEYVIHWLPELMNTKILNDYPDETTELRELEKMLENIDSDSL